MSPGPALGRGTLKPGSVELFISAAREELCGPRRLLLRSISLKQQPSLAMHTCRCGRQHSAGLSGHDSFDFNTAVSQGALSTTSPWLLQLQGLFGAAAEARSWSPGHRSARWQSNMRQELPASMACFAWMRQSLFGLGDVVQHFAVSVSVVNVGSILRLKGICSDNISTLNCACSQVVCELELM